jgi:hypothetical protein
MYSQEQGDRVRELKELKAPELEVRTGLYSLGTVQTKYNTEFSAGKIYLGKWVAESVSRSSRR